VVARLLCYANSLDVKLYGRDRVSQFVRRYGQKVVASLYSLAQFSDDGLRVFGDDGSIGPIEASSTSAGVRLLRELNFAQTLSHRMAAISVELTLKGQRLLGEARLSWDNTSISAVFARR
jgi:hypothetical protein